MRKKSNPKLGTLGTIKQAFKRVVTWVCEKADELIHTILWFIYDLWNWADDDAQDSD